ncbi:MAG: PTS sugar transporter subunit IIA [Candidatus Algichlamydia australiensis]|nr:PTS sugar transporter subunit IIA [Chlamydiales bacterium]
MDLEITDVAALLKVSEKTIEDWLVAGKIPSYRLDGKHRFSRIEIQDWMMRRQQEENIPSGSDFSLYRALYRGEVLHGDFGTTKEKIIENAMSKLSEKLPDHVGNPAQLFLERERMMSTALGRGIAVPHTREFLLEGPHDIVSTVFLERPVDWGSLDEKPVSTLFFLMATSDKSHLQLLARIAHLASSPKTLTYLENKPTKSELLAIIK